MGRDLGPSTYRGVAPTTVTTRSAEVFLSAEHKAPQGPLSLFPLSLFPLLPHVRVYYCQNSPYTAWKAGR